MKIIQKRLLLFLIGCIGTRALFAYLAKIANKYFLALMGYLAILPAIGFFYLFFTGSRKTGAEVFGQPIWWRKLRIIHGLFYLVFAILAIRKHKNAFLAILIDTILGLGFFIWHHYTAGNFSRALLH